MKGPWKKISGIAIGALVALAVIAPRLHAGPAAQDKFNLPFNAQWGKTTLSAGTYTLSVEHFSPSSAIRIEREDRGIGIIVPQSFDYTESQAKQAELVCVRHDGIVAVRALRLPQVGTFYFSLPKELNAYAAQPQMLETIPLESVGK